MKNRRINIPYCSKKTLKFSIEAGRKVNKILEPSKGGIGTRLKIAKRMFKNTIKPNICPKPVETISSKGMNLKPNPKTKATIKLAAGPAKATLAEPYF